MITPWGYADYDAHEALHLIDDRECGLRAIIAVHSTHLGPAAGGARFWHYADDSDALTDALRLSRGMSYKNAMAGLPLGGGKSVLLAPEDRTKSPGLLSAFGKAVEKLGGAYVTAEDVGMSVEGLLPLGERPRPNRAQQPLPEGFAAVEILVLPGALPGRVVQIRNLQKGLEQLRRRLAELDRQRLDDHFLLAAEAKRGAAGDEDGDRGSGVEQRGKGLSKTMLDGMRKAVVARGLADLVAPVRPSQKHVYPLAPIERYVGWPTMVQTLAALRAAPDRQPDAAAFANTLSIIRGTDLRSLRLRRGRALRAAAGRDRGRGGRPDPDAHDDGEARPRRDGRARRA